MSIHSSDSGLDSPIFDLIGSLSPLLPHSTPPPSPTPSEALAEGNCDNPIDIDSEVLLISSDHLSTSQPSILDSDDGISFALIQSVGKSEAWSGE